MRGFYIPLIAFLSLLLATMPFWFDFNTSQVPGWHTRIFPPIFLWQTVGMMVLAFAIIGLWLAANRADKANWTLFVIHFILAIQKFAYLKFLSIQLNMHHMTNAIDFMISLIPLTWVLFIVGHILFAVYFIRTIRASRIAR
jgi:hypothetical protein